VRGNERKNNIMLVRTQVKWEKLSSTFRTHSDTELRLVGSNSTVGSSLLHVMLICILTD
jgi:hypothetical protein